MSLISIGESNVKQQKSELLSHHLEIMIKNFSAQRMN